MNSGTDGKTTRLMTRIVTGTRNGRAKDSYARFDAVPGLSYKAALD
jgi:hypothetical protein